MQDVQSWQLGIEVELRLEVDFDATLTVTLASGTCELLGVELAQAREYTFTGDAFALFTWHGCVLETRGATQGYLTQPGDSTASFLLNVHAHLEAKREAAAAALARSLVGGIYAGAAPAERFGEPCALLKAPALATRLLEPFCARAQKDAGAGPRVMVVGSHDSGKTTVCATLAAYAARAGRTPLFLELDPALGDSGAPPGAIAAVSVKREDLSIEERSASLDVEPLSYWFGHADPGESGEHVLLYKHAVSLLASAVRDRLDKDAGARAAGFIVDSMAWKVGEAAGLQLILFVAAALDVDTILVMANDKLHADLTSALPAISVARIPRSGGLVTRDDRRRRRTRHLRVHAYFYGPALHAQAAQAAAAQAANGGGGAAAANMALSPSTLELRLSDVSVYRVVEAASRSAANAMLPVGQGSMLDPLQVVAVSASSDLVHSVLAVCHAPDALRPPPAQADNPHQYLLDCSAAGFAVVTSINVEAGTITLLTPCSGDLPSKHLLLGKMEWMEGTAL